MRARPLAACPQRAGTALSRRRCAQQASMAVVPAYPSIRWGAYTQRTLVRVSPREWKNASSSLAGEPMRERLQALPPCQSRRSPLGTPSAPPAGTCCDARSNSSARHSQSRCSAPPPPLTAATGGPSRPLITERIVLAGRPPRVRRILLVLVVWSSDPICGAAVGCATLAWVRCRHHRSRGGDDGAESDRGTGRRSDRRPGR